MTYSFEVRTIDEHDQGGRFVKTVDAASAALAWQVVVRGLLKAGILPNVVSITLTRGGQ